MLCNRDQWVGLWLEHRQWLLLYQQQPLRALHSQSFGWKKHSQKTAIDLLDLHLQISLSLA